MTKVVYFHQTGGPEVLKLEDKTVPNPGPGEVRIKVKALGLNRAESLFRLGSYLMQPKFPSKLGYEASGIIDAIGDGVNEFSIGDTVSVVPPLDQGKYGVYAELANVPAKYVVKHPSLLSFEEAAAVWMQYMTAYGALIDIAAIDKEDFVVIPAASSSVGLAAIQLCHLVGATPIATTRKSDKKEALKQLGAAHVIFTEEENLTQRLLEITNQKGPRVIFDPVGGKTVLDLAEAMAFGGILFQYGSLSMEKTPFPTASALKKGLSMRGYTLFEIVEDPQRFARAKQFLLEALSQGKLKPIIAKTFSLDEIVQAHQYLESNQQIGKIVVTV